MTSSTPWYPPPGLTLCNPPFMTKPTPLSPAPQAVLEKALDELDYIPERHVRWCIAAALRAAADQVVPDLAEEGDFAPDCCIRTCEHIRADLLTIAAELGGAG